MECTKKNKSNSITKTQHQIKRDDAFLKTRLRKIFGKPIENKNISTNAPPKRDSISSSGIFSENAEVFVLKPKKRFEKVETQQMNNIEANKKPEHKKLFSKMQLNITRNNNIGKAELNLESKGKKNITMGLNSNENIKNEKKSNQPNIKGKERKNQENSIAKTKKLFSDLPAETVKQKIKKFEIKSASNRNVTKSMNGKVTKENISKETKKKGKIQQLNIPQNTQEAKPKNIGKAKTITKQKTKTKNSKTLKGMSSKMFLPKKNGTSSSNSSDSCYIKKFFQEPNELGTENRVVNCEDESVYSDESDFNDWWDYPEEETHGEETNFDEDKEKSDNSEEQYGEREHITDLEDFSDECSNNSSENVYNSSDTSKSPTNSRNSTALVPLDTTYSYNGDCSSSLDDDTFSTDTSSELYSSQYDDDDDSYSDSYIDTDSCDDEDYQLPNGVNEDVYIRPGEAKIYEGDIEYVKFESDNESLQIFEINENTAEQATTEKREDSTKDGNGNESKGSGNESSGNCKESVGSGSEFSGNESSFNESSGNESGESCPQLVSIKHNKESEVEYFDYDGETDNGLTGDNCSSSYGGSDDDDSDFYKTCINFSSAESTEEDVGWTQSQDSSEPAIIIAHKHKTLKKESLNDLKSNCVDDEMHLNENYDNKNLKDCKLITTDGHKEIVFCLNKPINMTSFGQIDNDVISTKRKISDVEVGEENGTESASTQPTNDLSTNHLEMNDYLAKYPPKKRKLENKPNYFNMRRVSESNFNSRHIHLHNNSKFYSSFRKSLVLLLLKDKINFNGTIWLTLIAGNCQILGYELEDNRRVLSFSPRGHNLLYIEPITGNSSSHNSRTNEDIRQKLKEFSEEFSDSDIDDVVSNFVSQKDALILLEPNRFSKKVEMMRRYLKENIFPNMNSINIEHPFYTSEFILHCLFHSNCHNTIEMNSEWTKIIMADRSRILMVGGKGVGKSTLLRYVINKNISKYKKILLLDLDVGQSELFLPQTVTATIIDTPLLGPGYLYEKTPTKALLYGHINIIFRPSDYVRIVFKLIDYCQNHEELSNMPWVVNTMGYNKGFGSELMSVIISKLNPTDVVQIQSPKLVNNFDYQMRPEDVPNIPIRILIEYSCEIRRANLDYKFIPVHSVLSGKPRKEEWDMTAKDSRHCIIVSALGSILNNFNDWLNDVQPFCASFDDLEIIHFDEEQMDADDRMLMVDSNLVYLCRKFDNEDYECLGVGIVRAADHTNRLLHLASSVSQEILANVTALAVCNVPLPTSIILQQGPKVLGNMPYCYTTADFCASKHVYQFIYRPPKFLQAKRTPLA